MRAGFRLLLAIACALAALFGRASSAAAQTPSADVQQGPLVLTPIHDPIVFSPDVEVTKVNHQTGTLAGGYAGKRFDRRFLVGGGAYWLADPRRDTEMFFVGMLTGWRVLGNDRFGLEARLFAGAGQGEIVQTVQTYARPDFHASNPVVITQRVRFRDDFWVAEPKVVFNIDLTDAVRVNVGAGYRATTSARGFGDVFNGATGTVGVEFDLGR